MVIVTLKRPLAGIAHTVFAFTTWAEADEFASCLHARYDDVETSTEESGWATDVFEGWSF